MQDERVSGALRCQILQKRGSQAVRTRPVDDIHYLNTSDEEKGGAENDQNKINIYHHDANYFNPLTAKDELSRLGNLTFYSPGNQGGYLGEPRPMLSCVTLCPLITRPKSVKIPALN